LETEYEPMVEKGGNAWIEGNWGYPFAHFVSLFLPVQRSKRVLIVRTVLQEKDFEVYEPYCANYMNALELVEKETPNLQVS
jgi:cell division control protein 24